MITKTTRGLLFGALLAAAPLVHAASFDVTFTSASQAVGTASGTSNGIGWTMSPSFMSSGFCPTTDQAYTGFSNSTFFNPAVAATDCLHIFSQNLTLTFDAPLSSIDFYIRENGGTATLDFGRAWSLVSGEVSLIGATGARPSTNGGIIRFTFDTPITTLVHTTSIFDGMNAAWFAVGAQAPGVPEPATLGMLGAALLGAAVARRKRANG